MVKTALVTGASFGLGYEFARIHAENRGNLVLVARSTDRLDELKRELEEKYGVAVHVITKDLSLHGSAYDVYNKVNDLNIEIDYLINNAGHGDFSMFAESDWPKQERMINLNITALAHLTRLFLPQMIARKSGRILNVASVASFVPGPTMSVYFASKAFVLSFSEAIAEEVSAKGITVTALCPGPTESNFHHVARDGKKGKDRRMLSAREVSEYGYKAMLKGKVIAVPGYMYALVPFMVRFMPRWMTPMIIRKAQEDKHTPV